MKTDNVNFRHGQISLELATMDDIAAELRKRRLAGWDEQFVLARFSADGEMHLEINARWYMVDCLAKACSDVVTGHADKNRIDP